MLFSIFCILFVLFIVKMMSDTFDRESRIFGIVLSTILFLSSSFFCLLFSSAVVPTDLVVKTVKELHPDFPIVVKDQYDIFVTYDDLSSDTFVRNCSIVPGSERDYFENIEEISYGTNWIFPRVLSKFLQVDLGMPLFDSHIFIHVQSVDNRVLFENPELNVYH